MSKVGEDGPAILPFNVTAATSQRMSLWGFIELFNMQGLNMDLPIFRRQEAPQEQSIDLLSAPHIFTVPAHNRPSVNICEIGVE